MFRGLTKREHLLVLLILAGIVAAWSFGEQRGRRAHRGLAVSGAVDVHPPGELSAPEAEDDPAGLVEALENGLVDVNRADAELLDTLPGIGPAKAQAILRHREQSGPFQTPEDLLAVPGIGEKTLANLRDLITLGEMQGQPPRSPASAVSRPQAANDTVNINTASYEQLQTLNGIGPALAERIVQDRLQNGPYRNVSDLQRVKGIGPATVDRNRHRLATN